MPERGKKCSEQGVCAAVRVTVWLGDDEGDEKGFSLQYCTNRAGHSFPGVKASFPLILCGCFLHVSNSGGQDRSCSERQPVLIPLEHPTFLMVYRLRVPLPSRVPLPAGVLHTLGTAHHRDGWSQASRATGGGHSGDSPPTRWVAVGGGDPSPAPSPPQ